MTLSVIPASSFYASSPASDAGANSTVDQIKARWLEKLAKLHVQARAIQSKLEHSHPSGPQRPQEKWRVFYRQQQAFDEARNEMDNAIVFCFQDPEANGQRKYLISTYLSFWTQYNSVAKNKRHFYEVIPEGFPCKLYFDIEYMTEWNQGVCSSSMVHLFKEYVLQELLETFHVHCDMSDIIDMDSSSESKFSRHLIFNVRNAIFKDNMNVGLFVQRLIDEVHLKLPQRYQELMVVVDERGTRKIFVDESVYTKNRTFRIYMSSKFGKSEVLQPTTALSFQDDRAAYAFFLKSLICSVSYDDRVSILAMDKSLAQGKPATMSEVPPLRVPFPRSDLVRTKVSPFPRLDDFILELIQDHRYHVGMKPATIRSCVYFSEGKILVYSISGNRYCDKIGRNHKSNHVQIVCYFNDGYYVRKCFDPDCRRLPTVYHPLPFDCLPVVDGEFENDPNLLDDASLLELSLAQMESGL